jgi:hypothetical protein
VLSPVFIFLFRRDVMKVKVKLAFDDWQDKQCKSVYSTEVGIELSMGNFHSGSTWDGEIEIDETDLRDIKKSISKGI